MACALTSGRALDCRDSVGGIKRLLITELANKATLTTTSGAISAFTLATGKQFWSYEQVRETSNFSEAMLASVENGTLAYETTLTAIFNKGETATRNQIRLLAQNRLMIIAEDRNGKYWLLGETNGAELTAGSYASGTAMGDRNGYELTFVAKEAEPMKEVASGLIATLLAPAV
jgi:hypothetical protein